MGASKPELTRRVCPEIIGENQTCGRVHMSVISPTCPEHIKAAADVFWSLMSTTTPDVRPRPAPEQPKPSARKRPGKRRRKRT